MDDVFAVITRTPLLLTTMQFCWMWTMAPSPWCRTAMQKLASGAGLPSDYPCPPTRRTCCIWSACQDRAFENRLSKGGFHTEVVPCKAYPRQNAAHTQSSSPSGEGWVPHRKLAFSPAKICIEKVTGEGFNCSDKSGEMDLEGLAWT